ncbi:type I phosphomannose isomerase catalytic subunit [Akkermansia muciniphila]|jgi:mannose-6-phosphate isomerase|uniref:type I phosphomannose isomerase catalytic subunit n=1 Tax=Akkermansia muciniphila TaxID=239935 RepID=UPI000C9B928D|nr:type I phosphomannose isomerase catalytic subunit [Akkermansia muciniphila]PNC63166.1 mannose-6-phosphate isomerase [Akkermansia muciniphila]PNC66460.1 mannose-6-phosphate isomerase [Akkermansia muciniphila]QAT91799.1 mannose-6-phosphate isomerase [Akkermansia muciniphila]
MQPFRFHSIYQPRIWGGQSMRTMLGRELPDRETAYGEAWEISDRPEAMSIVKDGEWEGMPLHRLWEEHRQEIFGPGYERFPRFPLLCKILDARENLSVQVHPPERTAAARQGEVKNEIWYVLHASPDALIYGGMEENATLPDIRHAAETGQMEQLIRSTHLEPGEHLYIPAGLVHAIGAGHLIAEIQQNSDTTYRLYDWNRTDDSGRGRELHLEQALDSIGEFRELSQRPGYLTEMPYFTTKEYRLDKGERFTQPDSSHFAVFTVLCGSVLWDGKTARKGEFILSPAGADAVTAAEADTVLLSTTV